MAQTTSTGAKKIQDSDNWRDIFADHNETVDAYDGVITGTVSVITGTTNNTGHTIAAGEYFIANGSKYKATASIPSNTAWASSATAVSDIDIINSLNSAIKTVSTNLGSASSASSVTGADAFSKIDALNGKIKQFSTVSGTHTFSCSAQTLSDAGAENYSAPTGFTKNDIISIDAYVDGAYWARCIASRANNDSAIAFMVWNNTAITDGTIYYKITFMKG